MKKLSVYTTLFWTFFKIGLFTFGGGYAMIPLIQAEIAERKKWMRSEEILDIVIIAESTPGPISVNAATYVGFKVSGFWGAFFATLGLVLPSLGIIFGISLFFNDFLRFSLVQSAFKGIEIAVAILIFNAGLGLLKILKRDAYSVLALVVVFILMMLIDVFMIEFSSILLMVAGAAIGLFLELLRKSRKTEEKQ